jgi:hypothetical protein
VNEPQRTRETQSEEQISREIAARSEARAWKRGTTTILPPRLGSSPRRFPFIMPSCTTRVTHSARCELRPRDALLIREVAAPAAALTRTKIKTIASRAAAIATAIFRHEVGASPVDRPVCPLAKKRNSRSL